MPGQTGRVTLEYAIICDDVRFEMGDKISLMGVFDAITVPNFPTLQSRLAVVAAWGGLRGEAISKIDLVDPSGSLIGQLGIANIKETGEKRGARHIAVTYNVPFKTPGVHEIRIYLNGELIRSLPLPVRSVGPSLTGLSEFGRSR
jgi:hypothetical protein